MLVCINNAIVSIADAVLFPPLNKSKGLLNKEFVLSYLPLYISTVEQTSANLLITLSIFYHLRSKQCQTEIKLLHVQ